MPLDPEMIIAVQLSRSCTSVRVFAVFALFAFLRFAARFRVFAVFAFCCPFSRFRVFARKCRASPKAETHTFPAQSKWPPEFRILQCFGLLWEARLKRTAGWRISWNLRIPGEIPGFTWWNHRITWSGWIRLNICVCVSLGASIFRALSCMGL